LKINLTFLLPLLHFPSILKIERRFHHLFGRNPPQPGRYAAILLLLLQILLGFKDLVEVLGGREKF
jgi:hypothetical protein